MEVDYLNQLYFWEQPSYVERPFRTEQNFFQKNPNAEPTQRRCAFKVLSLLLPLACAQPTYVYFTQTPLLFSYFCF